MQSQTQIDKCYQILEEIKKRQSQDVTFQPSSNLQQKMNVDLVSKYTKHQSFSSYTNDINFDFKSKNKLLQPQEQYEPKLESFKKQEDTLINLPKSPPIKIESNQQFNQQNQNCIPTSKQINYSQKYYESNIQEIPLDTEDLPNFIMRKAKEKKSSEDEYRNFIMTSQEFFPKKQRQINMFEKYPILKQNNVYKEPVRQTLFCKYSNYDKDTQVTCLDDQLSQKNGISAAIYDIPLKIQVDKFDYLNNKNTEIPNSNNFKIDENFSRFDQLNKDETFQKKDYHKKTNDYLYENKDNVQQNEKYIMPDYRYSSIDTKQTNFDIKSFGYRQSNFDQKQQNFDKKQYNFDYKQANFDQKQPNDVYKQYNFALHQQNGDKIKSNNYQQVSHFNKQQNSFSQQQSQFDQKQYNHDQQQSDFSQQQSKFDYKQPSFETRQSDFSQQQSNFDYKQPSFETRQSNYEYKEAFQDKKESNQIKPINEQKYINQGPIQLNFDNKQPSFETRQSNFEQKKLSFEKKDSDPNYVQQNQNFNEVSQQKQTSSESEKDIDDYFEKQRKTFQESNFINKNFPPKKETQQEELVQKIQSHQDLQFGNLTTYIPFNNKFVQSQDFLPPPKEMQQITLESFDIGKQVGSGQFGDIFLARCKKTNMIFILKQMSITNIFKNNAAKYISNEIKTQGTISHQNIIQLYGYFIQNQHVYLILEPALDGHLDSFLKTHNAISESTIKPLLKQLLEAVDYLHRHKIVHRDIKLENILISRGQVKLADFGYANHSTQDRRSFCGTLDYIAPEIVKNQMYNEKVDVWAIGVIIYELLSGKSPFYDKAQSITYMKIIEVILNKQNDFVLPDDFSMELKDLLRKIFVIEQDQRLSILEIKNHPWFD